MGKHREMWGPSWLSSGAQAEHGDVIMIAVGPVVALEMLFDQDGSTWLLCMCRSES